MTRLDAQWTPFPYDSKPFDFSGAKLKKHWDRLHIGDREPYPDEAALRHLVDAHPALMPSAALGTVAKDLQDAWRAFHRGEYGAAVRGGLAAGPLGYNVANKAATIYASYLEEDRDRKREAFLEAARRAEDLQSRAPDLPNAWYLHAQALGRYGQHISVPKALAEGVGGKVKDSLERALKLEPRHADANIALGLYHVLIIHKMGSLVGGLTYGASQREGLEHFQRALALSPGSAIARIEYANALAMMFGKSRLAEALRLYEEAAAVEPADATERLDVELAKAEIKD